MRTILVVVLTICVIALTSPSAFSKKTDENRKLKSGKKSDKKGGVSRKLKSGKKKK
jgi:hypothetical protein